MERLDGSAIARAVDANEVFGEQLGVTDALPQRRHRHAEHVQAIEQIETKPAVARELAKVHIGRGDHSHVRPLFTLAADRPIVQILQKAQQCHLPLGRKRIHFVEEQRTAVGLRDEAALLFARIGEGTPAMAEQLVLDQSIGYRAAVDGDERILCARAEVVDGARRKFLAGAGLALH
jgi:hypothetical protein